MTAPIRPLHTTTVRFDADLWDRICLYAELLGVGKATMINMATREFIARLDGEQRPQQSLRALVIELGRRLQRVEIALRRRG